MKFTSSTKTGSGSRVLAPVCDQREPDIIAVHPDGRAVIYDVKTGQPGAAPQPRRCTLYMYLVPRVPGSRWNGRSFDGEVVYRDGSKVEVPAVSVNAEFIQKVVTFVKKMASPLPARKVPSERECGWCDIGKADCPRPRGSGRIRRVIHWNEFEHTTSKRTGACVMVNQRPRMIFPC